MDHKRIAIIQSNYIPWRGYFDIIRQVDEFILYDDVQYTRRDWRNRNLIKTPKGKQWLTIPVQTTGWYLQLIKDINVSDINWGLKHWKALQANYARAPFFKEVQTLLEPLYLNSKETSLSKINYSFICAVCHYLGIKTKISWSMDYDKISGRSENLVFICRQANATEYISGPTAQRYINPDAFKKADIRLTWMDYSGYPDYSQPYPPFEPTVSIVDLLFSQGKNSIQYLSRKNQLVA